MYTALARQYELAETYHSLKSKEDVDGVSKCAGQGGDTLMMVVAVGKGGMKVA